VPREDADALAAAIERLLADRALAVELGHRARELAEARYTLGPCVDAYERLYSGLLGTRVC